MYCYDDSTLTFNMFHKVRPFIKLKMQNPKKFTQKYCIRDKLIKESKVLISFVVYYTNRQPSKRDGNADKQNWKFISILCTLSKIFETITFYDQSRLYFDRIFLNFQYSFCKIPGKLSSSYSEFDYILHVVPQHLIVQLVL